MKIFLRKGGDGSALVNNLDLSKVSPKSIENGNKKVLNLYTGGYKEYLDSMYRYVRGIRRITK